MILIDKDGAEYIRKHTGAVVIGLQMEPSVGGCVCSIQRVTGTYLPVLSLGKPRPAETDLYNFQLVENIEVYFQAGVATKVGHTGIRIKLSGMGWFHWLELEGAKAIACYNN